MKPIVKWAGGKYKLSKELEVLLPENIQKEKKFLRYIEPFFGGGGFFFYLGNKYDFNSSILIEKNSKLFYLYEFIKKDLKSFKKYFEAIEKEFLLRDLDKRKEFYYFMREKFNTEKNEKKLAILFLFLNKTCFNGLYRENSSGGFNVPFGSYKAYNFFDEKNINEVSLSLKNSIMINGDFEEFGEIKENDFFYFDPPYVPLSKTSSFTSYTKDGFGIKDQKRLINLLERITKSNAKFMLSNSYSEETIDMYKEYNVNFILAGRSINSKKDSRNKIKEIIVRNY